MLHQSNTVHFDTVAFSLSPNGSILFDVGAFRTIIHSLITEKPERDSKVKISVLKNAIKYIIYIRSTGSATSSALWTGLGPSILPKCFSSPKGRRGRIPRTGLFAGTKYYKHASDTEADGFNEKT